MADRKPRGIAATVTAIGLPVLAAGLGLAVGLYSAERQNWIHAAAKKGFTTAKLVLSEAPNHLAGGRPVHFLRPERKEGQGVTINETGDDGHLVLISSFFDGQTGLRLIRRDGTVVAGWPVSLSQHFPDLSYLGVAAPQTDRNVDLHGAVINPDGSVVFNYEYAGSVKLSRCGEVVWTLPHPTHHSVERAEGGGYWIGGRNHFRRDPGDPDRWFPPFTQMEGVDDYADDLILRVSETGEIVESRSVTRILYESGLEPLMTANGDSFARDGVWRTNLEHLNKIAELGTATAAAFPMFEPGDLAISLRSYNLIAVIDPDDWRVKWHQTGPWRRQHDPEFLPNGRIAVFNNNTYRTSLLTNDRFDPEAPFVSNVLELDPSDRSWHAVYGNRPGQEFLSVIRGKIDPTPGGGYLVTEFEAGRVFEIDPEGRIVWEYINRYDDAFVTEITEARSYPAAYFTVTDWSCPAP